MIGVAPERAWKESIDREVKEHIIQLNTEDQLGEEGIDSKGSSLGQYRPFTVQVRTSLGLQVGHVDFRVTGEYWDSWKVRTTKNGFTILVDRNRYSELVNDLRFSEDHVGLTDQNLRFIGRMVRDKHIDYVRQRLLR